MKFLKGDPRVDTVGLGHPVVLDVGRVVGVGLLDVQLPVDLHKGTHFAHIL